MSDWKQRLTLALEPILRETDPRPKISAYHNMPYAVFRYPPDDAFAVRGEITMLRTRLEQAGKRVTTISLANCLAMALEREGITSDEIKTTEAMTGTVTMVKTIHMVNESSTRRAYIDIYMTPPWIVSTILLPSCLIG